MTDLLFGLDASFFVFVYVYRSSCIVPLTCITVYSLSLFNSVHKTAPVTLTYQFDSPQLKRLFIFW